MLGYSDTYVVGLGEANEFLNGERVVRVLVGMLLQRQLSVLLLDVSDGGLVGDFKNLEGVEGLQVLDLADNLGVEVPDVPEEGGYHEAEVERTLEGARVNLALLEGDHGRASTALALRCVIFNVDVSPNHSLE